MALPIHIARKNARNYGAFLVTKCRRLTKRDAAERRRSPNDGICHLLCPQGVSAKLCMCDARVLSLDTPTAKDAVALTYCAHVIEAG